MKYIVPYPFEQLDLTIEALVLRPEYHSLFTEEELKVAEKRLRDDDYDFENN